MIEDLDAFLLAIADEAAAAAEGQDGDLRAGAAQQCASACRWRKPVEPLPRPARRFRGNHDGKYPWILHGEAITIRRSGEADRAAVSERPMLEEIHALPGAERHVAVLHRDGKLRQGECGAYVRGHIVGTFQVWR